MRKENYFRAENGFTPTGAIITIIIICLLVLLAITVGKPFLFTLTFNSEAQAVATNCIKKNDAILLKNLKRIAEERDFVLKDSDIKIRRDEINESITVDLKYSYYLKVPFYEKNLEFTSTVEGSLQKGNKQRASGGTKKQSKETIGFFEKIKGVFGL